MSCDNCANILNHNKYKYDSSSRSYILSNDFMNKEIIVYKHKDSYYLKLCCVNTFVTKLHIKLYKWGNMRIMPQALLYKRLHEGKEPFINNHKLFMIDSRMVKLFNIKRYTCLLTDEYTDMRASVHHPLKSPILPKLEQQHQG